MPEGGDQLKAMLLCEFETDPVQLEHDKVGTAGSVVPWTPTAVSVVGGVVAGGAAPVMRARIL